MAAPGKPPEPIVLPRFWLFAFVLIPIAAVPVLASWPWGRESINEQPWWWFGGGALFMLAWLGLFRKHVAKLVAYASSAVAGAKIPEPIVLPRFWVFAFVLLPIAAVPVLASWPWARQSINEQPWWWFGGGALFMLVWLGLFGKVAAHGLDFWLRTFDFWLNRTYGPEVQGFAKPRKAWYLFTRGGILNGYSTPIVLWTLLTLFVIFFGPTRTPLNYLSQDRAAWLLMLLAVLPALLFPFQAWKHHRLRGFTTSLVLAAIAVVGASLWGLYVITPSGDFLRPEAENYVYPHVFLIFIAFLALLAYFGGRLLASWLIGDYQARFGRAWTNADLLKHVELFVRLPRQPKLHLRVSPMLRKRSRRLLYAIFMNNLGSAINTPLRHPHLLLLPVAIAVLLLPSAYINLVAVTAALLSWSVLALAGNHERLNNVLSWLQRLFFHGLLAVVSVFVIILAGCRFFNISYIATITNSASSYSLIWFLVSIYAILWYYEYWVGYTLSEQMLKLLNAAPPANQPLPYRIDEAYRDNPYVLADDRYLQMHGTRFVAVGAFVNSNGHGQAWEFYDQYGLFEAIARHQPIAPKIDESQDPPVTCKPVDPEVVDRKFGLSELRQRVQLYHVLLDGIAIAALGLFFFLRLQPEPKPELTATKAMVEPHNLRDHLFPRQKLLPGEKPAKAAVLLAASGGGTRAAIYSAAVLRGLKDLGALEDVRLCSGVSGGSAAIAHFAIDHQNLMKSDDEAWTKYAEVMTAPFIDDVLCGTLEIRLAFGTRMGTLLDESLHRQTYGAKKVPLIKGMTLHEAPVAVIFNSTLAGSVLPDQVPDPTQAGSRLIVTNLGLDASTFPAEDDRFSGMKTEYLHYIVVNDPDARLTTGAALSANFPPVFSNAAVDVTFGKQPGRYWVTDGGAAENRGAISLLYALLHTLREERKQKNPRKPLPIQIVIAEASAVSQDFTQDRGLGSVAGAAEKFASQLARELFLQVNKEYEALKGDFLDVHFLPMPLVLRGSHGGIGTHWKLPLYVTLENPIDKKDPRQKSETLILSDTQTRGLIMDLFLPEGKRWRNTADVQDKDLVEKAWKWIEGDAAPARFRQHRDNWEKLEKLFKKKLHY